jgi:hypothetical protein
VNLAANAGVRRAGRAPRFHEKIVVCTHGP